MDPISFNETFVKDIFDEIDGINGKRKGVVHDREFTTVTNDDVKYKPKVGDSFESVESAEKMYRKYANEVGFDVRLSNKKINKLGRITSQFYVCSKEGRPKVSGRTIRNSNIKRSGCGACLKIHLVKEPNQYEVYKFVEQHNHILFNKEEMRFSRSKRQLHYADHKNVFHGSSSKVGVTKSHRFIKAVKGGVDSSGGTVRDHQNFKRDMTYFVGNKDAQMLLNVMANRRKVTTKSTIPRLVSPCKLEAHAAEVYTRTIFFEIQKELRKAVWLCGWDGFTDIGETRVYIITHKNKASKVTTKYTVIKNKMENSYDCSCNCFVRNGISCRHALKVMLNDEVDKIPDKYILRRWRRDLVPVEWLPAHFRYGEVDAEKERLMSLAYSYFERILGRVQNEKDILSRFVDQLVDIELPLQSHTEETTSSIKEFLGVSQPETVDVLPPTGIRNKGCGTGKRLISAAEKAIPNGKKQNKKCRLCGQMATHDSRNCPKRDYI
ncbi:FAR1 DNA binding domain-containing protein [Cynara cardunculus var. scolymus]|uniref:FAR1 DNA binding domain-containing protein n=1 Tax=Cynara cardunculus var. scolymus TaxID=59895 RepID=A0A118K1T7_CYNCS|nr:FAR1 DNA binding domain-containing protein [Cynara cardunculus var. scolymus]